MINLRFFPSRHIAIYAVKLFVTRSLADGFRLFATGLVLAALLLAMPGLAAAAQNLAPGIDPAVVPRILALAALAAVLAAPVQNGISRTIDSSNAFASPRAGPKTRLQRRFPSGESRDQAGT